MRYDSTKVHGNIPVSSKCEFSWSNQELCLHQLTELIEKKISRGELKKRDFTRKK